MKCLQKVSNDFGVGFHQCTRNRIEGSDYCQQHHDLKNPQEFVPVESTQDPIYSPPRVTVRSTMTWESGRGPQVKMDYTRRPVFLRSLRLQISSETDYTYLRASGPWIKKNGEPAATGTDGTVRLEKLPEKTQTAVYAEIERMRKLLP